MIENSILEFLDNTLNKADMLKGLYCRDLLCLEIPKERSHGDLSTNIAFRLAKPLKTNPIALAKEMSALLRKGLLSCCAKEYVDKIEDLNGFINFHLSAGCLRAVLKEISVDKERFGASDIGKGRRIQVEFVSANPTGTLSVAHARQAVFGDSLANILTLNGYRVNREYYVNDEGVQINILGKSIYVRYKHMLGEDVEFPADGYRGDYIKDIAAIIYKEHGNEFAEENEKNLKFFSDFGVTYLLDEIKKELLDLGVEFDCWYSQRTLSGSGKIEEALKLLKDKELLYEREGALWFKSTAFGDDKDRVVKKSDGSYTYVTPDIAYHKDKFERGFDKVIDVLGPDHHGYINRIKAAVKALGYSQDNISIIIIQLATLYKDGKPVRMSTRAGEYITLREVLDEVGRDAARFFFLMRKASAHLDFDLELAKRQTPENPVYYVQYAHARICSILALSGKTPTEKQTNLELLSAPEELELLRELRQFPLAVRLSAQELEPYKIILYLQGLAMRFHKFYEAHKVVSDDEVLTCARLFLVLCTKQVLANGLSLLGISSPNKM